MSGLNSRPDWERWAFNVAGAVATRGDCTRRQVGAVILDQDNRVVSTGYNGAYSGGPSCLAGECPRGRHYERTADVTGFGDRGKQDWSKCACGEEWPCDYSSAPGSEYSNCIAIHAEANALLYARASLVGCTIYVTAEPCNDCSKLMHGAGLKRIVWRDGPHVKSVSIYG